jgi:hypothetical protein
MRRALSFLALCALPSCVEMSQEHISVPLFVAGTDVTEPMLTVGDVPVVLERADLAFGPLVFCAGTQAGGFCDTARLEWLDSVVVDALDGSARRAGELYGVTGVVRSYMYDLGISSQLTRAEPFVLDAAAELGGMSVVLSGVATVGDQDVPFRAEMPIQQESQTELGVPVIRKSASARFSHDVGPHEAGLLVRFDPRAWLRGVDFRPHVEEGCCTEPLVFEPGSPPFRAVRQALFAGDRPSFTWGFSP